MTKRIFNLEMAEKLYVEDLWTLKQIATELGVSEPTLRKYCQSGNWKAKKADSIAIRQSIFSDTKDIVRHLGKLIKKKLEDGVEPSATLMNFYTRLLSILAKVKDFEDSEINETADKSEGEVQDKTVQALKKFSGEGVI